jgi:glycyl-tRNA synthetase alpha subunit
VLPALDYCLKCSHMFNLMDASGGIGVTERMAYILKVRQLAVAIAKSWAGVRRPAQSQRMKPATKESADSVTCGSRLGYGS